MAYVHLYKIGNEKIYRITSSSSRPAKIITLEPEKWEGRVSSSTRGMNYALETLENSFKEVKGEEKEEKKARLSDQIKSLANKVK